MKVASISTAKTYLIACHLRLGHFKFVFGRKTEWQSIHTTTLKTTGKFNFIPKKLSRQTRVFHRTSLSNSLLARGRRLVAVKRQVVSLSWPSKIRNQNKTSIRKLQLTLEKSFSPIIFTNHTIYQNKGYIVAQEKYRK